MIRIYLEGGAWNEAMMRHGFVRGKKEAGIGLELKL